MAQVKYVHFLHRLIKHTTAAHAYVSPRSSWLILGIMPVLGHVIFIRFHFKKTNEMKKEIIRKTISHDLAGVTFSLKKCDGESIPRLFLKKSKLTISLDQYSQVL